MTIQKTRRARDMNSGGDRRDSAGDELLSELLRRAPLEAIFEELRRRMLNAASDEAAARLLSEVEAHGAPELPSGTSVRLLVERALEAAGQLAPTELTAAIRRVRPGAKNIPAEVKRLKDQGVIEWVPRPGGGPRDGIYRLRRR